MTINQLKDYLNEIGFEESERNTFSKKYKVRDTIHEDLNFITAIYKVSKGVVFFKMKSKNRTETMKKGRLDNISINESGELEGFKNSALYS